MAMGKLDRAALEIASLEYPDLQPEPWLAVLDAHASALAARVAPNAAGIDFLEAANEYLFGDLGFRGEEANYYDPRNSCLNEVLEFRTGLPITLSVVYMEICRRLARPVYGIGLPGHFIVQYDDGCFSAYLDPFHQGAVLSVEECFALARTATGTDVPSDPALLKPVTHRQLLQRMLNNLRAVYFSRQNWAKALRVLDLVVEVNPNSAEDRKQRGVTQLRLNRMHAARVDLERYLELSPEAADAEEIRKQLLDLRQYLAGLN